MPHDKRTSKFLSLVLRHRPDKLGLTLDSEGYVDVAELLAALARNRMPLTREALSSVVSDNDKQRFAFNEDGTKIRASQGHSVPVDLGYVPAEPPAVLYHGTALRFLDSIKAQGLVKGQRLHVHLSATMDVARTVGARHGKPVILEIDALGLHARGHFFYLTANGVWLIEHVPIEFLKVHT